MKPAPGWALGADAVVVAGFVVLGRDTHEASFSAAALLRVAAPFLMALAAMWILPLVRTDPWRLAPGAAAGAGTAVIGLALRSLAFGDGVSGAFPVVAFAFLTAVMAVVRGTVGWRRRRLALE